jgi:hypothetical protein
MNDPWHKKLACDLLFVQAKFSFPGEFMPKMAFAILIGLVTIPLAWADKAGEDFFERSVRPILAEQCLGCHGAKIQKSSLRLDSKAAILKGGISGPVVIPGKPSESLLVQAIHQKGELKMPQGRKLSSKDINSLEKWVAMGLPWPDENSLAQPSNQQSHWAFSNTGCIPSMPSFKRHFKKNKLNPHRRQTKERSSVASRWTSMVFLQAPRL